MAADRVDHDTVIIGGGQAGLSMSYLLTGQGRDHVVLEKRDQIGATWRQRWDSFTLVTPNWQMQLPGHEYSGDNPTGFLERDGVVEYLEDYASAFDPPISFGVEVTGLVRDGEAGNYRVRTRASDGTVRVLVANNVVVATGTFQTPDIPPIAERVPDGVDRLHAQEYASPGGLADGGVLVVGSGQSGCQIAKELHENGRRVHLCVGSSGRLPRSYRGRDVMFWAEKLGIFDQTVEDLDSPAERFAPNPQTSGRDGGQDINLHAFARDGILLLGHLEGFDGGRAILADDLHENLAAADKMAREFRKGVDTFVSKAGLEVPEEDVAEPRDGFDQEVVRELELADTGIGTILWATGFKWDYSWIEAPVFDDYGYPIQERGITEHPGLYFVGLHFLHKRKSGLFYGVGDDARHVAEHIADRR